MQRRTLLATAATVVAGGLAGCSGADDAAETETPSPEPTPDPEAEWTAGDGIDATALEESHAAVAMDAGSFTVRSTADTEHSGEEQPNEWLFSQELVSRFDDETERQALTQDLHDADETTEAYVTTDRAYVQLRRADGVEYRVQELDRSSEEFKQVMSEEARVGIPSLGDWNLAFAESTTVDDRPAFRYEGSDYAGDRSIPATIEEASVEATIDDRGFVHRLEREFAGEHEGQDVEITVTIAYEDLGETEIDEPDWLDEARERTGE